MGRMCKTQKAFETAYYELQQLQKYMTSIDTETADFRHELITIQNKLDTIMFEMEN